MSFYENIKKNKNNRRWIRMKKKIPHDNEFKTHFKRQGKNVAWTISVSLKMWIVARTSFNHNLHKGFVFLHCFVCLFILFDGFPASSSYLSKDAPAFAASISRWSRRYLRFLCSTSYSRAPRVSRARLFFSAISRDSVSSSAKSQEISPRFLIQFVLNLKHLLLLNRICQKINEALKFN